MKDIEKMSFEEALKRLEEIADILENGQPELDVSMKLFEEGTALTALCDKKLKTAELKISEFYEKTEVSK